MHEQFMNELVTKTKESSSNQQQTTKRANDKIKNRQKQNVKRNTHPHTCKCEHLYLRKVT